MKTVCTKSEWHGAHDADSPCPYCDPPAPPARPTATFSASGLKVTLGGLEDDRRGALDFGNFKKIVLGTDYAHEDLIGGFKAECHAPETWGEQEKIEERKEARYVPPPRLVSREDFETIRLVGVDEHGDSVEETVRLDENGMGTSENKYISVQVSPGFSMSHGFGRPFFSWGHPIGLGVVSADKGSPEVRSFLSAHPDVGDFDFDLGDDPDAWDVDLKTFAARDAFESSFRERFPSEPFIVHSLKPTRADLERLSKRALFGANDPYAAAADLAASMLALSDTFLDDDYFEGDE